MPGVISAHIHITTDKNERISMTQHAIIIDPFSSGRFLADEFASRGVPCIAVMSNPIPADFEASYFPEKFAESIFFDGDLDSLCARLAPFSPLCVMIGIETGLALMDQLAARLGLPGNDPQTSSLRRDKYAMQEALHAAGVRAAKQKLVENVAAASAWLEQHHTWPVIVKPTNSAGSDNVMLCQTMDEALHAVERVLTATNLFGKDNQCALLQEYLAGREWVVDTVSCGGKHVVTNVTRYLKTVTADLNMIYRHSEFLSPANTEYAELVAYALSVCDVLGIRYGAAHIEIIMTEAGPTLVEVNARMHGGDAVVALRRCHPVTQLDLSVDAHINAPAFALKAQQEIAYKQFMIAHFLISRSAGKVMALAGQDLLKSIDSYVVAYLPGIGKEIKKTISLTTAPGYIWLANENEQAMWQDQQRFIELEDNDQLYSCAA
jgi:L-amino acid ligase